MSGFSLEQKTLSTLDQDCVWDALATISAVIENGISEAVFDLRESHLMRS